MRIITSHYRNIKQMGVICTCDKLKYLNILFTWPKYQKVNGDIVEGIFVFLSNSVADLGFPRRGANPKGCLAKILPNTDTGAPSPQVEFMATREYLLFGNQLSRNINV